MQIFEMLILAYVLLSATKGIFLHIVIFYKHFNTKEHLQNNCVCAFKISLYSEVLFDDRGSIFHSDSESDSNFVTFQQ